jgi:ABC-type transporter Mla maintaining outer membrane lipid asymmetry ATPase subunit MlaF
MGPSGAGKSVLAQLSVGLLRADAGRIELYGEDVTGLSERRWLQKRSELAYLAQGPALLDWLDLRDNLALALERRRGLGRAAARAAAEAALDEVGLGGLARRFPGEVGPGVTKRASMARALACRPRALVYDEPTTGLEPHAARQVDAVIARAAAQGVGAVVVTHDLDTVRALADRVVILAGGGVGADGDRTLLDRLDLPAVAALLGT